MEDVMSFVTSGAPSHILLMGGGPRIFFGFDILAERDFFGSMKDAMIFLGCKRTTGIFFEYCVFITSDQQ